MMIWLPGAKVVDMTGWRGNGPFDPGAFRGVILHVNVSPAGTSDDFFASNPAGVTPNFQVYKDGSIHQYLPLDYQPWCQVDGNYNFAAIETAGMPDEPLTDAQLRACAQIVAAYIEHMGMPSRLADTASEHGLGTHAMGGPAWGGHACPGDIRAAQRQAILDLAAPHTPDARPPIPITPTQEDDMALIVTNADRQALPVLALGSQRIALRSTLSVRALKTAGVPVVAVADADYTRIRSGK